MDDVYLFFGMEKVIKYIELKWEINVQGKKLNNIKLILFDIWFVK